MCKRILASQTNTEGSVPFYKIGTIGGTPDAYISKELFDDYKAKYNYPHKGEVMITCAGTVGKCVIYDGKDAYYQDSNIVWIDNPSQHINNGFLYHLLANVNWRKLNSTTIIRIYNDDLRNLKLSYPQIEEQKKISRLLSLLDERIATQNKIIEELKKQKVCVRRLIFRTLNCSWFLLSELEASGDICLKRGNIIPKHEHTDIFCYPVYSSSVQNGGLMGYNNTYMFNTELVTWSIDGGGNFFYRHKHKFNVTNVSGYMQLNEAKYNYRFVSEILLWQHSFMVFDYQTKAHPSVIRSIYKLPDVSLAEQELIANIFRLLDVKLQNEMTILKQYQQQKQYLLRQMFI